MINSKLHIRVYKSLSDTMNLFITFELSDAGYNAGGVPDSSWGLCHWLSHCQQIVWWNLTNLELVHRLLRLNKWKFWNHESLEIFILDCSIRENCVIFDWLFSRYTCSVFDFALNWNKIKANKGFGMTIYSYK